MSAARQVAPTSDWIQRREPRQKVLIRARMRAGGLPVDVCICDVSTRGMCLVTSAPPVRGTIIELTDIPFPIVGKVVWSSARRFGVTVRGSIDLASLLTQQRRSAALHNEAPLRKEVPLHTYAQSLTPAEREQRSREAGRAIQFLFISILGAATALVTAHVIYDNLSYVADAVSAGMQAVEKSE